MKARHLNSRSGGIILAPIIGLLIAIPGFTKGLSYGQTSPCRTASSKEKGLSEQTEACARRKLLPVDEAPQDPSFLRFRKALLQAIDRRDADYLIGVLHKSIKLSFGGDWGVQRFIEIWDPYSPQSAIWKELGDVLRLGGTFGYANYPRNTFWAPYVFGKFPQHLDAFKSLVIVARNVKVHAGPSRSSQVIATLSYHVVAWVPDNSKPTMEKIGEFLYPWRKLRLADQQTGYVIGRYIRSPIDYRAAFDKIDGAWKLTLFLKGD